jgi:hypothetical protein
MSGKVAVCTVCPKENQQIEAIIKLPVEKRSVIHGTVLDANGNPVADAVVKLLQVVDGCKLPCPLTHTFTDQYGQFLLGPLCPNVKYMLKVYKDNIKIKYLPLDVDCYDGKCIGVKHCPPRDKDKYNDHDGCDC